MVSCADSILNPEAPLALRLSGQLLLGVVRVYSKKVGYLYVDCNEALTKMKQVCFPQQNSLGARTCGFSFRKPVFLCTFPEVQSSRSCVLGTCQAFKPAEVDLPEEGAKAPVTSITLPENYNDIEFHLGTGGGLSFTFE